MRLKIKLDDPLINSLQELVEMKQVLGSSKLLEMILENVPKDFTYKCSGKTDQEIWYEERRNKHG